VRDEGTSLSTRSRTRRGPTLGRDRAVPPLSCRPAPRGVPRREVNDALAVGRHGRPKSDRQTRLALLAALLAVLLLACGGDPAAMQSAIDQLSLPGNWQVAKTMVKGGSSPCVALDDPYCPSATRYYNVSGPLPDALAQTVTAVTAEGFTQVDLLSPHCDANTNGAVCSLTATRDQLKIEVNVWPPGQDVDSQGVSQPGQATVRIKIRRG
jgi:hypothetical protein